MGYLRNDVKDLADKDYNDFINHYNRLELLYEWVQKNKINVEQFKQLIEIDKNENQRQIDLDTFD